MNKIIGALLVIASLICHAAVAQEIDVNWSDRQLYDNKMDGFFETFVGSNSKYVYARFEDLSMSRKKKATKIKLVSFDKNSMEKQGDVTMVDPKDPEAVKKYSGLVYYKAIVFENVIYVFWTKESKTKDELFIQSFDNSLNPINELKKIYELNSDSKSTKKATIFVMGNEKAGEQIVIGGELASLKGSNVVFEYKVVKSDFSFVSSNKVTLPVVVTGRSDDLSSSYELGDDGNLHIKTFVIMSKEDRKMAKKGEATRYPIYSIVDLTSGAIKNYTIKFDNKNVFDFDFLVTKTSIKVFGFFCDLTKDTRGEDTHGIFYAFLDPKTFLLMGDMHFTYFTKQQLDNLFTKDKQDRKDKHLFSSNKKQDSEDESLSSGYIIEDVQSVDDKNIVLFCSRMYNYTVTTTDSKGNRYTSYYCQRDNVTAFKLNNVGNIEWASNLDRRITYSGWFVYDLHVISKDDKFYVAYGSDYSINTDQKSRKSRKSGKYKSDRFEYAVFDYATGKFTKNEYKVNPVNVKKENKKTVSATNIMVLDNQFYVNSKIVKRKIVPLIACFVCYPVGFILGTMGSSYHGDGYLGHVSVIK
jgi:hypothetical protein